MAYRMATLLVTLKVIPKVIRRLQAFSSAIRRTFAQHFNRFQLTARRAVPRRQLGFLFYFALHKRLIVRIVCVKLLTSTIVVEVIWNFTCKITVYSIQRQSSLL